MPTNTKPCPDCGKPVDDRLDRCTRCVMRRPRRAERVERDGRLIGWVV